MLGGGVRYSHIFLFQEFYMKRMKMIAAALLAAGLCMGCSDGGDDKTPEAPVVNLPESKGENPFKGKTFAEGDWGRYVFSADGKTVTLYYTDDDDIFVPAVQYRCSVDADKKELSWAIEKVCAYSGGSLLSFEECVNDIESGKCLEDYTAILKERLDAGDITQESFDERLAEYKESTDEVSANDFASLKMTFSAKQRFTYTYKNGTLDLEEQFEESSASFWCYNIGTASDDLYVSDADVDLSGYARVRFEGNGNLRMRFENRSFSSSEKKIVFENEDNESDTFTATYTLQGSGNDTTLVLSFTYNGTQFKETLSFEQEQLQLTEITE